MEFKEYIPQAIKTESDYVEFLQWIDGYRAMVQSNYDDLRLIHGVFGLVTEAGELSENFVSSAAFRQPNLVNIREELGDLMWYSAIIVDALQQDPDFAAKQPFARYFRNEEMARNKTANAQDVVFRLLQAATKLEDRIKRFLCYGKDFELQMFLEQRNQWDFLQDRNVRQECPKFSLGVHPHADRSGASHRL